MSKISGSIITDCADNNARSRQQLRFSCLFGVEPTFHGVGKVAPDVEAAGNLIDQLDALTNLPKSSSNDTAVILVNVAPRGDKVRQKWDNGVPFCYFQIGNTLVVSTYSQQVISLIAHKNLATSVELLDVPTVTAAAVEWANCRSPKLNGLTTRSFEAWNFSRWRRTGLLTADLFHLKNSLLQ